MVSFKRKVMLIGSFSFGFTLIFLGWGLIFTPTDSAQASGPWYVSTIGNDGNDCLSPGTTCATINGAIGKASPGDTINVATGIYTGTGDEVVFIDKSVMLIGGWDLEFTTQIGTANIDGEETRVGIKVYNCEATVDHLTIYNGSGSGVVNLDGTITFNHSIVRENKSSNCGGIDSHSGDITMNNSTVSNNLAVSGGGICNVNGTLTLNNSTVSNNSAKYSGGISMEGLYSELIINSSTVSNNSANIIGGGILFYAGSATLQNSIVAGNTAMEGPDCIGNISSNGYNLIGNTSGCTFNSEIGDMTDIAPVLGKLVGKLGYPWYHPLLSDSPAIDAGNPGGCTDDSGSPLNFDQRNVVRLGRCDIGAYEYTIPGPAETITAIAGTPQRTPPYLDFWSPLQAVVLDEQGTPVDDMTVNFSAPADGASGIFGTTDVFTTTAITNNGGVGTAPTFSANGVTGNYTVTASVKGILDSASFLLSNIGWYVSTNGDDTNDCQSSETPCSTINSTLEKVDFLPADTVLVSTGKYTGTGEVAVLLDKEVHILGGWDDNFSANHDMFTIDGEGLRQGIKVNQLVTATIDRFLIQNGFNYSAGGIHNEGDLVLTDCIIRDNTSAGIHNNGAAIINNCSINGNSAQFTSGGAINNGLGFLILNNSTVSYNSADSGGGISNNSSMIINNSTISNNSATFRGGGISNFNSRKLVMNSSTVSKNSAEIGGGIYNFQPLSMTIQNTIVSGNTADTGPDCSGGISSIGYSIIGNTSDCEVISGIDDQFSVDPRLFQLTGTPAYHPLLPGSPAIDAGDTQGCKDHLGDPLETDQRGEPRVGRCDIGSYEHNPATDLYSINFLPITIKRYCEALYYDDFSDSSSGWPTGDDGFVRLAYENEEYRVWVRPDNWGVIVGPGYMATDYALSVEVRLGSMNYGTYGLIFGFSDEFSGLYSFEIDMEGNYWIMKYSDDSGWKKLHGGYSEHIYTGTEFNQLTIIRDGEYIKAYVNSHFLAEVIDGTYTGLRYVGLGVFSYNNIVDVVFDNFVVNPVYCYPSISSLSNNSHTDCDQLNPLFVPEPMIGFVENEENKSNSIPNYPK